MNSKLTWQIIGKALVLLMVFTVPCVSFARARMPLGSEAVVVDLVGDVSAHLLEGSAHSMHRRRVALGRNDSVGPTAQITTGRNGQVHLVLSTGVMVGMGQNSSIVLEQLRNHSQGIPRSEADLVRQVHIRLERGRMQVFGGTPSGTLDLRVLTSEGMVVANGGTFSVAQLPEGNWGVFNESDTQRIVTELGDELEIGDQRTARLWRNPDGGAEARLDDDLAGSDMRRFEGSLVLYHDLQPFMANPTGFDRQALGVYVGGPEASTTFVGGDVQVGDVSPSFRPVSFANVRPVPANGRIAPEQPGNRWDQRRIWDWYEAQDAVKGVNYIPRYAVNSVEMWSADRFDPDIIEEELGWARDAGYTSVRVQLQAVVWQADPDGFMERLETFLDIANHQGLKVVPILFDDMNMAGADPIAGPQPDPIPGQHNARWLPSPGHSQVVDPESWPALEAFVTQVMETYRRDNRVLFWDMYNMPGAGPEPEDSLPLMAASLRWARDTDPEQPIAVAVWSRFTSAMSAHQLELSDFITFQSFEPPEQVDALLAYLKRFDRPVICTDWLMRQRGNDFDEILPIFARNKVGWFNRGLVNGRTQKWLQQVEFRSDDNPDLWQHDVLQADGTPYRQEEVEAIRAFQFIGD